MVLRVASMPLGRSVHALDAHLAALQESGRPVLVVTNRLPADYLVPRLERTDRARLAVIDASSGRPPAPVPEAIVEHVAGPHLLELLRLRARRLSRRAFDVAPHTVYYDVDSLARAVPVGAILEMMQELAAAARPETWLDLVVHERSALPKALQALLDDTVPERVNVAVA